MIRDKKLLFLAKGGKEWIGGIYYVKNVLYTLIKNNFIDKTTSIYILVDAQNADIFKPFVKYDNVKILINKETPLNDFIARASKKAICQALNIKLLSLINKYKIDYIFPINSYPYMFLKEKCIYWIPDFQHIHLPEMFSESEIKSRNKLFDYIAEKHKYLVLSSNDAFNDFKQLYPYHVQGVKVLNFESYIEEDIKDINDTYIKETLKKYNLPEDFLFLPNQFWKHKNHITAFKAMDYVVNKKGKNICLVCTGNINDYRNYGHFESLKNYINQHNLENNIKILGFILRKEQLALMIASRAIIQPSLFEGWGTVVEDAKALDKDIIMSDINVHYEQKNDKCIIFKRDQFIELGNIILGLFN